MLNEDDRNKGAVMAAIRCGESDEDILGEFRITSKTLTAIKTTFRKIETMLGELKPVSEIAQGAKCSEEFIEEVKRIIETDEQTLLEEATSDPEPLPEPQKPTGKKGNKAKHIDQNLKNVGEEQSAAVLVDDAGEISKGIATQRQAIGKFVMEKMSTVAMQFGYPDIFVWLEDEVFPFWIQNQGRIKELDAQIQELLIINQQLQEAIDLNILGVFIAKKVDSIMYASVLGGGDLDVEKLHAYKQVLLTDPVFLKQLYDYLNNVTKKNLENQNQEN